MNRTCLVLAGGMGTRMGRHTKTMPKALIPVHSRPFIHYQLDLLEDQGFTRICLLVGYKGEQIMSELEANPHDGIEIQILADGETLLGTGGSVRRALEMIDLEDEFFVTYGDSYLLIDPVTISNQFDRQRFDACMALYNNRENLDANNARMNQDGSVFYKKNSPNAEQLGLNQIDFGISLLTKKSILEIVPSNTPFDLATYFEIISERNRLQGSVVGHRFYEIGSETGLSDFESFLTNQQTGP